MLKKHLYEYDFFRRWQPQFIALLMPRFFWVANTPAGISATALMIVARLAPLSLNFVYRRVAYGSRC